MRKLIVVSLLLNGAYARAEDKGDLPVAPGPFKPDMDSLKQYQYPAWFRDAKFGIWAVWGPQSVREQGDWYARQVYIEGHPKYVHHLKTFGHPSEHGYKDIAWCGYRRRCREPNNQEDIS